MSIPVFTLKNEMIFIIAEAAGGVYNSTQLKALCEISDEDSLFLKVTEDSRIGFMIPPEKEEEIQKKLSNNGLFLRHYRGQNFASPKSCLGSLCPKAQQDVLSAVLEISPLLNEKLKNYEDRIAIGVNGCSEACAGSACDDIHIVGYELGYKIYMGGKSSETPKLSEFVCEKIDKEKIGDAILSLIETYYLHKQEQESIAEVLARIGIEPFYQSCLLYVQEENILEEIQEQELEEIQEQELEVSDEIEGNKDLENELGLDSTPSEENNLGTEASLDDLETQGEEIDSFEQPDGEYNLDTEAPLDDLETPGDQSDSSEQPDGEYNLESAPSLDNLGVQEDKSDSSEQLPQENNSEIESPLEDIEAQEENIEKQPIIHEDVYDGDMEDNRAFDNYDDDDESYEIITPISMNDETSEYKMDVFDKMEDDGDKYTQKKQHKQKVSIKFVGQIIRVILPSGLDFQIPNDSLNEGEMVEMQVEDDLFIIENLNGKIHIKCGELEMTVPALSHKAA